MKTVSITVFGERAKIIEKELGLKLVRDEAYLKTKVIFKKLSAEGRSKILITIVIGK